MFLFCFKQKTAYEMRISDWSSDVCSSDLKAIDRCYREHSSPCLQFDANQQLAGMPRVRDHHRDRKAISHCCMSVRRYRTICSKEGDRLVDRSEERREGKEGVSTFRSRWSRYI